MEKCYMISFQWNLVNSKSYGLEVLFPIISSSYNRTIDIKTVTSKKNYYLFLFFLSNINFGWVKETSQ